MALRIKFHAYYVCTKILIFIYNNAQIHSNILTVHQFFCILHLCYRAILKKASLLSRKHEKRAFILRFPTEISRLLKLKDFCTVWSKRFKKHVNAQQIYFYTRVQIIHTCIIYIPCVNQRMWTGFKKLFVLYSRITLLWKSDVFDRRYNYTNCSHVPHLRLLSCVPIRRNSVYV